MASDPGDVQARGPRGTLAIDEHGRPVPAHEARTLAMGSQDGRPVGATPGQLEPQPPSAAERAAPRHVLVKLLGKGGMGEVYAALDPELKRKVAFKRLLAEHHGNPGLSARFLTEVQVTAQLDHPNVVPVNGFELAEDGSLGYSMKLIKGRDLSKLIEKWRGEQASLSRVDHARRLASRLDIFLRLCEAMSYAHGKGVLHRDLKPENVMVGLHNDVYVMDWGIFRLIGDPAPDERVQMTESAAAAAGHGKTLDGMVLGTPAYMSPEQASGKVSQLDERSDLFTLGVILAELITLRPARTGTTVEELLRQAQQGALAELVSYDPRLPIARELKAIVARATALAPDQRYRTVRELADDLRRYLRGEEVKADPDNPVQRMGRALARHRMIALATIFGLLAIGAAVIAWQVRAHGQARAALTERHARHQALAVATARHADLLDGHFARWEVASARLVGRAGEAVVTVEAADPATPVYLAAAFDGGGRGAPPDLAPSTRYRHAISAAAPVVQVASGVALAGDVERQARRIAGLRRPMQDALLTTSADPAVVLDDAAARALLLGDGVPALRAFVTLASGVHVSYPGAGGYPPGYDGRARKKYTSSVARGARRVHWGDLYADRHGLGLVLPVTGVLHDRGGEVAGVAGLELSLTWLAERLLALPGASWVDDTYLLDAAGTIVVHLPAGGAADYPDPWGSGESEDLRAAALTHDEARRAVTSDEAGVLELADGRLAAVYPLTSLDYTLLVVADPRRMPAGAAAD